MDTCGVSLFLSAIWDKNPSDKKPSEWFSLGPVFSDLLCKKWPSSLRNNNQEFALSWVCAEKNLWLVDGFLMGRAIREINLVEDLQYIECL